MTLTKGSTSSPKIPITLTRITNEQKAAQRRARILSANKNASAAVRAERDRLFNRELARSMSGEAPATDEEV